MNASAIEGICSVGSVVAKETQIDIGSQILERLSSFGIMRVD